MHAGQRIGDLYNMGILTPAQITTTVAQLLQDRNPPIPKYLIGQFVQAAVDAYGAG